MSMVSLSRRLVREDEEIALGWLTNQGVFVVVAKLEDPVLAGDLKASLILFPNGIRAVSGRKVRSN